ncbi:hypothetical protein FEM48_Zijuj03G0052000 [Ziziphus jujuba var. spinosa]|uniref:4-coumarate--CoA ligase-like 5 n=1 Tax=Ziziphus jujuba var. spinosa TaxID=714518 RepID=A0A978VND4_ZIZJJ|nr:hypothetical protein FEM48_Zijuj03G0052000 [Ziziphus jujuba var. spinosa]
MSAEEAWTSTTAEKIPDHHQPDFYKTAGFDSVTGIYRSLYELGEQYYRIPTRPDLDTATFVLSQFPSPHQAESRVALIDSATGRQLTYAQLHRSIRSLASGLYHALGVRKGDVVFLLSPNSLLYPTICLAVLSVGAILTTANPLNTESELAKQVTDSGAKLAISAPEELHKLAATGVPIIPTISDDGSLSVVELIENCDDLELDHERPNQSDTAAILYSSGTTGTSKGVVLTHSNFISVIRIFKWCVDITSAQEDVFLCFIPMFHIYGLAVYVLSLFCSGITTVLMARYELKAMLDAIKAYGVNNIPAVPPVILGLVKHASREGANCDLSSLRRMSSGAAPLSNEVAEEFRRRFPWVELRPGYGLTESCGAATFSVSDKDAKFRSASCGRLLPTMCGKIVDPETGKPLPPYKEGELWVKSGTNMKEYLGKEEATAETIDPEGWLKTGDLCYFDENGYLYIVDRIKELIKHNGYQILDTAVIPVEDEEAGQIPMAYVVRAAGSELKEADIIEYVARQVAPYKKVRKVGFIGSIPRSAAGKILRKELILQSKQQIISRL